jgi:hypothetical protein
VNICRYAACNPSAPKRNDLGSQTCLSTRQNYSYTASKPPLKRPCHRVSTGCPAAAAAAAAAAAKGTRRRHGNTSTHSEPLPRQSRSCTTTKWLL